MKILVTGGAGYIGSHLTHEMVSLGHEVCVLDSLVSGHAWAIPKEARFVQGDIADAKSLKEAFRGGIDAVFHFAAFTSVEESTQNPNKYYDNNTYKSLKFISACISHNVKYFIFSSTAAVYGNQPCAIVSESFPTNPISPYGYSKLLAEKILEEMSLHAKMRYTILRYFNVAGASLKYSIGQATPDATNLIKVVSEVAAGKRSCFEIFGTDYNTKDGSCIRDFIHVDDLVNAHILAFQYLSKNNAENQTFNCGYQSGYSVKEVVAAMKRVSNVDFEVRLLPKRLGDIREIVANTKKIKDVLHFNPQYNDIDLICKSAYNWEKQLQSKT